MLTCLLTHHTQQFVQWWGITFPLDFFNPRDLKDEKSEHHGGMYVNQSFFNCEHNKKMFGPFFGAGPKVANT